MFSQGVATVEVANGFTVVSTNYNDGCNLQNAFDADSSAHPSVSGKSSS
jgi:hypothetical protein